ncbi:MAG TPA: hypothetical protein VHE30_03190 [Polyangiaceae bacterium]|nr:hypothetical protein [Polyangiaceae bacterium]
MNGETAHSSVREDESTEALARRAALEKSRLIRTLDHLHVRRQRFEEAVSAAAWGARFAVLVLATVATAVLSGRRLGRGPSRSHASTDDRRGTSLLGMTVLVAASILGGFLAAKRVQSRRDLRVF